MWFGSGMQPKMRSTSNEPMRPNESMEQNSRHTFTLLAHSGVRERVLRSGSISAAVAHVGRSVSLFDRRLVCDPCVVLVVGRFHPLRE